MRQMALQELREEGERCRCIRCREVGHVKRTHDLQPQEENIELVERDYEASGGHEYFQSFEDTEADIILGFTRLRAPSQSFREEIDDDTLIVRQLKVMGSATDIGSEVVISAVGTREYYRKFGYEKEGPYMVKYLD
jgi:elongator complex protein 3